MVSVKKFTVGEAITFGWNIWKKNIGFFFLIMVISAVIYLVLHVPGSFLNQKNAWYFLITGLLGIVGWVVQIIIQIGFTKIELAFVDGKKPVWQDLFSGRLLWASYAAANILYGLIVGLGFVALIVPGIYLGIKYGMYRYLIVDKNMGVFDSFKESARMTNGIKWHLFKFYGALAGLNIVGFLLLLAGLLATIPTSEVANAYVYRKLSSK